MPRPSAMRSSARPSTATCRGFAAARFIASSPSAWRPSRAPGVEVRLALGRSPRRGARPRRTAARRREFEAAYAYRDAAVDGPARARALAGGRSDGRAARGARAPRGVGGARRRAGRRRAQLARAQLDLPGPRATRQRWPPRSGGWAGSSRCRGIGPARSRRSLTAADAFAASREPGRCRGGPARRLRLPPVRRAARPLARAQPRGRGRGPRPRTASTSNPARSPPRASSSPSAATSSRGWSSSRRASRSRWSTA